MKDKYPYKNLSLADMDGEEWRPMPGFEAYYEVSSKGRIKSLERRNHRKNGMKYYRPSRIMKQYMQYSSHIF